MKNILRNFWLTLSRFKTASILNILGLTVAFTVFIVIMTQTYWELTYNKNIKQHERIFRLTLSSDKAFANVNMPRLLGETIGKSSPAIESYGMFTMWSNNNQVKTLELQGQIKETNTYFSIVSSGITDVLSLELLSGDFKRFEEPKTAIISKTVSDILFPDTEPVGNIIICPDRKDTLLVVAVCKNLPENCTFKNGVFSNIGEEYIDNAGEWSFYYFYKLNSSDAKVEIEKQSNKIAVETFRSTGAEVDEDEYGVFLEPFSDLYYSKYDSAGNKAMSRLLVAIALIIILIAIINYINFFIALVPVRIRSININKVFGTPTVALRLNIIGEAVGILLLSFGLAVLLVDYLSGTSINEMIDASLKFKENLFIESLTAILVVGIGIFAGLFPAFYITKFNPALVLKGSFGRSKQGQRLRSVLVIFQFTISIILIIGASFIHLQSRYMQKYDYGFNRERLVTVWLDGKIASQPQAFVSELRKNPNIEDIAFAENPVLGIGMTWGMGYKEDGIKFYCLPVSWNYMEFMDFELKEGRFFKENDDLKPYGTIIFNEAAAKKYEIKVGDFLNAESEEDGGIEIVGIVKDFNFHSLRSEIEPLALYKAGTERSRTPYMAYIRLKPDTDFKQTSAEIASAMQAVSPSIEIDKIKVRPFDVVIGRLYNKEVRLTQIISLFSLVAIIISLMGVFGIVVFENQHRRKEIALRKVHGSTATLILGMFNRKFIYILLVSFVIAAPIAYFSVVKWLSGFAYRTPVYWWVFALGFLVVAFITLLTVTLQTFHTASENPVKAMKSE
jgi:putative ABC transport system permease protein